MSMVEIALLYYQRMTEMNTKRYIFDVDGTLTPSRSRMNTEFALWFSKFCDSHDVYLVTGSDRKRTIDQLGEELYNKCTRVYQCAGNDVWEKDVNIRTSSMDIPADMLSTLEDIERNSAFEHRTGDHMDRRPGLINFSVLGKGATTQQRADYYRWDNAIMERAYMVHVLATAYGDEYDIAIAGDTGIDITRKNSSKKQILTDFSDDDIIHFYGDNMYAGGNDRELALEVLARGDIAISVDDWVHTWSLLEIHLNDRSGKNTIGTRFYPFTK